MEKVRAIARSSRRRRTASGRVVRPLDEGEKKALAGIDERAFKPRASIWRDRRVRDAIVTMRDQRHHYG